MKKLTKQDFKKLALKGVAAGMLLASQASAQQLADVNNYANMLAAGCGGKGGCGGATAYRNVPPSSSCSTSYNPAPSSEGCNAMGAPASSSCSATANRNMPSSGCAAGRSMPSNSCSATANRNMPSNSCSATTANNPSSQNSSGNAGNPPPTKYYYTDNEGKWREGQPPREWTDTPENPSQDRRIDMQPSQPRQGQGYQGMRSMSNNQSGYMADSESSMKVTEQTLPNQLNSQTREIFENLSPEGKAMAVKMANQSNDKNQAVQNAAKAMAEKRAKAMKY